MKITVFLRYSVDRWPYPGAEYPAGWTEIGQGTYDELLGCVPPLAMGVGWFFVGEEATTDDRGVAVHALCVNVQGRFFLREVPTDQRAQACGELLGMCVK